jgi:hypothetical protein
MSLTYPWVVSMIEADFQISDGPLRCLHDELRLRPSAAHWLFTKNMLSMTKSFDNDRRDGAIDRRDNDDFDARASDDLVPRQRPVCLEPFTERPRTALVYVRYRVHYIAQVGRNLRAATSDAATADDCDPHQAEGSLSDTTSQPSRPITITHAHVDDRCRNGLFP